MSKWSMRAGTVITPEDALTDVTIVINHNKFERLSDDDVRTVVAAELGDTVVAPGLINGHDHLLGTYHPKVGNGPYENWLPWDNDLKSSPVYEERQQIENRDLYLLGAYRNLVSGVTAVSDHIPHFVNEPFLDLLPTRAIRDYALAHSIASFALAWGDGVEAEYQKAVKNDIPFITHIAEGFDAETRQDVTTLDRKGGLGDHSVLVHGLAFSDNDIALIKKKGASVVWCADSNLFMFNKTAPVNKLLEAGVNVCIGTDSPMSGGENLLFEMKFDKALYKKLYNAELPDKTIVKMVTMNAARAFHLRSGHINAGYTADLVAVTNRHSDPYRSLVAAELADIELVVIDGKPVYAAERLSHLFEALKIDYQHIVIDGSRKIIIGDLIGLLKRISRAVGFKKEFPFLPVAFNFN